MTGVESVWPGCLIQFEDFKQHNALRILDRYQSRVPSFNDDIQGTAAVVVAGVITAMRATGRPLADARVVLVGAGAAGIGIARLLRAAGVGELALVDSKGLVHAGRAGLEASKADARRAPAVDDGPTPDLLATIARRAPERARRDDRGGRHVQRGRRGRHGRAAGPERAPGRSCPCPTRPRSARRPRPTSWRGPAVGRSWRPARRSPRSRAGGQPRVVGQANNAFIFPGVGLGAIVAEAPTVTDEMFLTAARVLAACVTDERLAQGALYPPVAALRSVSRAIAVAVAGEAHAADVDDAMWWPDYVPYLPVHVDERRRVSET